MGSLEELKKRYSDRAEFYLIYLREAHPDDGWKLPSNSQAGIVLTQHRTARDREAAARRFCESRPVTIPVLLDRMDNSTAEAYAAFPDRIYLLDRRGRVVHKGGRGPLGFDPQSLEEALILTLLEEDTRG